MSKDEQVLAPNVCAALGKADGHGQAQPAGTAGDEAMLEIAVFESIRWQEKERINMASRIPFVRKKHAVHGGESDSAESRQQSLFYS